MLYSHIGTKKTENEQNAVPNAKAPDESMLIKFLKSIPSNDSEEDFEDMFSAAPFFVSEYTTPCLELNQQQVVAKILAMY